MNKKKDNFRKRKGEGTVDSWDKIRRKYAPGD